MAEEGMTGAKLHAMNHSGAGHGEAIGVSMASRVIPHIPMKGSVLSAFLGKMDGALLPELNNALGGLRAPTPGAALGTAKLGKGGDGPSL